ncbi:PREDICTED: dehydrogenase/reductase SDR family member 13 [Lepidothrix coronata]|uniref:Dehydrogenase/reductase SDR family member 13 n=1 Tax=Lepidothrix coronata TaxID=321398 RepID=A0A6J0IMU2_9PASS|nr:PREDICTED: dehydrogenase/reductase SDR family member 13 [Lepidothrix coronata]
MGWALLCVGLLLALYTLLRHGLRSPPRPRARPALRGRTAIVTGGSSGIGAATALELARCGARVILATRNALRGEAAASRIRTETGNEEVRFMHLDLASLRSVRAFASTFLRQEPHLHLLINNAGVSAGGTTEDGFSLPFQVNHLGHFLLTQLLLERLRSCGPSRVVIVASSAHCAGRLRPESLGRPPPGLFSAFQDYCDSKLANVLHARELATREQDTQVTCYAVHPGFVNTALFRHAPLWLKPLLLPLAWLLFLDPSEGAQVVLDCATRDGLEPLSGRYFTDSGPQQPWPRGRDDRLARALWESSERLVGLGGDKVGPSPAASTAPAQ